MLKQSFYIILMGIIGWIPLFAQSPKRIIIDPDIQLIHLQDSIFIHLSWDSSEKFGRFSSNGLILISEGRALMVDTPMDNEKTERLAVFLRDSLHAPLSKVIVGHFHDDCLGGLDYIQGQGIESVANDMTLKKCQELDLPLPGTTFTDSLIFDFYGEKIECRFFGGGHSFDNITVWLPDKQILFGGCLIRSMNSKGLGNLRDAVVDEWANTIHSLMDEYEDIQIVIPGHGDYGGVELLTHTLNLIEKQLK